MTIINILKICKFVYIIIGQLSHLDFLIKCADYFVSSLLRDNFFIVEDGAH